ncbi:MAG: NAD(P)/FAD-dependent oxidoreductase [Bacillota bacterium]
MQYVIIGNSTAAVGGIEGIRQVDRVNPITVISEEPFHTYSRPLISYFLAGKVHEQQMLYRKHDFYENNGVNLMRGIKAERIDPLNKRIVLNNGAQISYDKVLLATGGKPYLPKPEWMRKPGVFTFTKLEDAKKIRESIATGDQAVVVGAGLIGLKAAEALNLLGMQVTVIDLAERVLSSILDSTAAGIVQGYLEAKGISFELTTTVEQVFGENRVEGIRLSGGKEIACKHLVVAIGVVPNTELVLNTPIKVNRGILVNSQMQTNVSDVYAAGDVAESYDLLYRAHRVTPILPLAYTQGEIAGKSMGGGETSFNGGFAMNSIGFFNLPIITAGIILPPSSGYKELVNYLPGQQSYKKLVVHEDKIVGFILINEVDRAGIITGLIREEKPVGDILAEQLLQDNVRLSCLPAAWFSKGLFWGGKAS